jgi:hypothetical protein
MTHLEGPSLEDEDITIIIRARQVEAGDTEANV